MVSQAGIADVLDRIAFEANTRVAVRVLGLLLRRMEINGRVPLKPLQIACLLGEHHAQVYRVLQVLADIGAIVVDKPSRRETHIRFNMNFASKLEESGRAAAQAKDPPVRTRGAVKAHRSAQPVAA